jgi:multidrug efflux pump subunit AcrB
LATSPSGTVPPAGNGTCTSVAMDCGFERKARITPDREALGRYGLMVGDVQDVIATALGGESVTNERNRTAGRQRHLHFGGDGLRI